MKPIVGRGLAAQPLPYKFTEMLPILFHPNTEYIFFSVGTSIARPHGRGIVFLSHAFDIGNARHSAVRHKCRTLQYVQFLNGHCILTNILPREQQAAPLQ